jgi:predicted ribosome quality control (RQC) complex YloA/Tae2 family protein
LFTLQDYVLPLADGCTPEEFQEFLDGEAERELAAAKAKAAEEEEERRREELEKEREAAEAAIAAEREETMRAVEVEVRARYVKAGDSLDKAVQVSARATSEKCPAPL